VGDTRSAPPSGRTPQIAARPFGLHDERMPDPRLGEDTMPDNARPSLIVVLVLAAACSPSADEVVELTGGQARIASTLAALDRRLEQLAAAPAPAPSPPPLDPDKVYDLPTRGSPVKGPAGATVSVVEFADFQCPFCAQAAGLMDDVLAQYPTGVKWVFKQFPLTQIHPFAMHAAKASLAAHKQGRFWELHDVLFENHRALEPASVKSYAEGAGLDMARFERDMASPDIARQIEDEMRLARDSNVRGTPTLYVNGKRVTNRSLDGLKAMIDPLLKN
jgi:protein-disulfide isomerase